MTTATTSTFELSRDSIITRGAQLSGLWDTRNPLSADDIAMLADILGAELLAWQADGLLQQHATRTTLAIVSATAAYTLPADTLDVAVEQGGRFFGMFKATGSNSETRVEAITAGEYLSIPYKAATSYPRRACIERGGTSITVTFDPIPSISGTFSYRSIRVVRDNGTGAVTLDLPKGMQKAVLYAMAAVYARTKNGPAGRIAELEATSQAARASMTGWDRERPPTQFRPYG